MAAKPKAHNPNVMVSGDVPVGFLAKLRDLAVKSEKTFLLTDRDSRQFQQNGIGDGDPSFCDELKKIKSQVASITESAKKQLLEIKEYNANVDKNLKITNDRISAIENNVASTLELLKTKGISIEKFEKNDMKMESPQTPEQTNSDSQIGERKSQTPDIGSFGLSSPTMRFVHSKSTDIKKHPKTRFTAAYAETLPKFHFELQSIDSTEIDAPQTPETPELTVYIPIKQAETTSKNVDITNDTALKFVNEENLIPEEPELTCRHQLRNIHENLDEDDFPSTPKFSLKYNFM